MSLPEYVTFFDKDGRVLHTHFVNVGWHLSKNIWIDALYRLPKIYKAHTIKCYGIIVASSWVDKKNTSLLGKLYDERLDVYEKQKDLDGHVSFGSLRNYWHNHLRKIRQSSSISHDDFRRALTELNKDYSMLLAKDIVGVQPMTGKCSEVFTLRTRYGKFSKWQKLKEVILHKLDFLLIYGRSIVQYHLGDRYLHD